jgi:vacuolar-type H+-ATPase subunit H
LREYFEALRRADHRFDRERDRRYTEVGLARAEALKIKEAGDAKALELAREIQTYKDEKANELREQINQERGLYATKAEIAPLTAFVLSQQGGSKVWNAVVAIALTVAGFIVAWLLRS